MSADIILFDRRWKRPLPPGLTGKMALALDTAERRTDALLHYKRAIARMYAEYGVDAVTKPGGLMEFAHSAMLPTTNCQGE